MTNSSARLRLSRLRRISMIVAAVSGLSPFVAGCVSAVDESSAFGFNNTPAAAGPTAAPAADEAAKAVAGDGGEAASGLAAADVTPGGTAEASANDVAAISADTAEGPAKTPIASGRTTIAAYAGGTVDGTSPSGVDRERGSASFTSLFTQSKAKTPIRNAETGKGRRVVLRDEGAPVPADGGPALPGVKTTASLFEIGQRASADYDAEILEEAQSEEASYQVASLSGMARLAPNGLTAQRADVRTDCFEPQLVSMLKAVETRFNTKVLVTSGYRSPSHNKRVNGARRSMHMACKAADIRVPGANKLEVANFLRSLPGRGGVGTYCHTTAVHVDIGQQRDWNWACRRRG